MHAFISSNSTSTFSWVNGNAPQTSRTVHYVNAKVVLVGDTASEKLASALFSAGARFKLLDFTAGRQVWALGHLGRRSYPTNAGERAKRYLWDLAGQPGYRVIHQLHLSEVAVALVVFDARSETDPLAGVLHWERALRAAHQRQGDEAVPLTNIPRFSAGRSRRCTGQQRTARCARQGI